MTERIWTIQEALNWTREYLTTKKDEHPRRSAEWLLSSATGLSRVELYAYHDRPLTVEERATLRESVKRRALGEPLQYVSGEVAFRHIVLKINKGVLIPRPETETLVEHVLTAIKHIDAPRVLDVCTGSGCIGLSVVREHETAQVVGTDISLEAVSLANANAERLDFAERFVALEADLCELLGSNPSTALDDAFDVVVSNPPYIPSSSVDTLDAEVVGFEPRLALDGGEDGLDIFRRLILQAHGVLKSGGLFAVELDERNVTQAAEIAVELDMYQNVVVSSDLVGRDRYLLCNRA